MGMMLFLIFQSQIYAQTNTAESNSSLGKKYKSIEKGYKSGENDEGIATKYEELAKELVKNNELAKAEEYQKKAVEIFTKTKSKKELANALRLLAKIQEAQNKTKQAITNYDNASKTIDEDLNTTLNNSDVSRLQNSNNPVQQSNSINSKISKLKSASNTQSNQNDIQEAYVQMAEVQAQNNNTQGAIENYNKALEINPSDNLTANGIKNEIATIYANNNDLEQAIQIKNTIIQNVDNFNDVNQQIKERQSLANLLILNNEENKAIILIQEAYNIAINKGKTIEAKNSLLQLIAYYKEKHDDKKTLQLYEVFLQKLESLIKSDSTLIDVKLFEETDNKIKQLELEKSLKDELIEKKNSFNFFLIVSLIILLILIIIIIVYSVIIKKKNKKISLQSLRREMNPHFIFNSLNSVNQFIAQNKEIEANKFLTSYSSLMRNMMENSSKDFIPIQKEIDQLKKYLDLEHLRFNDKFDFEIFIDETIDTDSLLIPNMLIQPHLENAIWHGLRYKEIKGFLKLSFFYKKKTIEIIIEDNGIGIKKSKELKTENQKLHKSIGLTNINERIALLNDLYHVSITCEINDNKNLEGTIIKLIIPQLTKI